MKKKIRLDKIHISVRNGLTVKITQMFIFDSQPFFFIYLPLQAAYDKTITAYSFLNNGHWNIQISEERNIFKMKWKRKAFLFRPVFRQKYFARFILPLCITRRVYNVSESFKLYLVKQRVPAVPPKFRVLTCSSIFGTHLDSEVDRISQEKIGQFHQHVNIQITHKNVHFRPVHGALAQPERFKAGLSHSVMKSRQVDHGTCGWFWEGVM